MYLEYIQQELLPLLQKLLNKYSIWWSFKSDSLLKEYLEEHNIYLNNYFCPSDLCNAILTIITESPHMKDSGNSNIIVLDEKLQECFMSWIVYKPDLLSLCRQHVNIVPIETSVKLQNDSIANEIFLKTPDNVIFNDPASTFWLHPEINAVINNRTQVVYTWKEINDLFIDFCTSNQKHFYRVHDDIFQINANSIFASIFQFKFFHLNQIEDMLKKVTFFLGKSDINKETCNAFRTIVQNVNVFGQIDYFLNICTRYLPPIYTPVHI